MAKKRLLPEHPLMVKLRKAEQALNDLDLEIRWDGYKMLITDQSTGVSAIYRDADSSEEIMEFPYNYEIKLIIED